MKKLLILLILAGLGVGGWFYYSKGKDEPIQYQSTPLARGEIIQAVTCTGILEPVLSVQVGSQISGNIQKLYADFNTEVKAGQVVAQLDPSTFKAAVAQAEGELASAKATARLAELTAKRQRELTEQKVGTAAALDNAEAELMKAESTVLIRTAQVEKAKVDLGRCTIYAPIDGVVISRDVDVGQTVAASLSAPVIFIIANDLRKMQIKASVGEADVGNVVTGQAVTFTVDAFLPRKFHGKVTQVRVKPITLQNVVTYDTIIEVNNEDLKLKPGMTANVSIVIQEREDALKLPNAALRFRLPDSVKASLPTPPATSAPSPSAPAAPASAGPEGAAATASAQPPGASPDGTPRAERRGPGGGPGGPGGPGGRRKREGGGGATPERTVFVLVNGQPQPVKVKLGISDNIFTEVLDGLKEGDAVITGSSAPQTASAPQGGSSPFGGGSRRRF